MKSLNDSGSLDDLCWSDTASEVLEAYRQNDTPMTAITRKYRVTEQQVLALVDEAGFARRSEMATANHGNGGRVLEVVHAVFAAGKSMSLSEIEDRVASVIPRDQDPASP